MRNAWRLAVILVIGLLLRLAPVLLHGMPGSYDTPFHLMQARGIVETGFIGFNKGYPPLYHALLAELRLLGVGEWSLALYLLPALAALLPLTVYLLVREMMTASRPNEPKSKGTGEKRALLAAFLAAVAPPLTTASYDSPENLVLVALPLVFLLVLRGNERAAGFLYALSGLVNVMASVATSIVLLPLMVLARRKKMLMGFGGGAAVGLALYAVNGSLAAWLQRSPATGMDFIAGNVSAAYPVIALLVLVFVAPMLWVSRKGFLVEGRAQASPLLLNRFWFYFGAASTAMVFSFYLTPVLRGWEFIKFASLGAIVAFAAYGKGKLFSGMRFSGLAKIVCAALFVGGVFAALYLVYPSMLPVEKNAVAWLAERQPGTVLAEPSYSMWLRFLGGVSTANSLFYEEKAGDFDAALRVLAGKGGEEALFAGETVGWLAVNFEDWALRPVFGLVSSTRLNKLYSLSSYRDCGLPTFPRFAAAACGSLETGFYKVRE